MSEKKLDAMSAETEAGIHNIYITAVSAVLNAHRKTFEKIKNIMDGKEPPPKYCVTEGMKQRWRERKLSQLLNDSGADIELALAINKAGDISVDIIKQHLVNLFRTAYEDVME